MPYIDNLRRESTSLNSLHSRAQGILVNLQIPLSPELEAKSLVLLCRHACATNCVITFCLLSLAKPHDALDAYSTKSVVYVIMLLDLVSLPYDV